MSAAMASEVLGWAWEDLPPMQMRDLPEVMSVEHRAYPFPWTQGNFADSLACGYEARILRDAEGHLVGYFVGMMGVDEMHLLNITVSPEFQRKGHGLFLLQAHCRLASSLGALLVWLEVRQSNHAAQALYKRFGFQTVGLRRAYYPAAGGQREDALVMNFRLQGVRS